MQPLLFLFFLDGGGGKLYQIARENYELLTVLKSLMSKYSALSSGVNSNLTFRYFRISESTSFW